MATKPKKNARYDLNAADRRRNLLVQVGLTAIVVLLGVGLVLYIVMGSEKKPESGEAKSIRVTDSPVTVRLTKAAAAWSPPPSRPEKAEKPDVPSGYKIDVPY